MTTPSEPTDDLVKKRDAQLRSMPLTRMLDYGMDYWDATHLAATPATDPWDAAAARLAQTQIDRGDAAVERGDHETAVACYRRGSATLVFAQMAFNEDTERKRDLYRAMSQAYQDAADLDNRLLIERLEVPYRAGRCTAWLVRAREALRGPTVVIVGGQSGWGPAFHQQAETLARRGLSVVLLEAPGQGESRMFEGLHLDADSWEAFSATLDAVRRHAGVDGPSGVWGNSFGGLLAARAAIHDDRFVACCVNGAPSRPLPAPFRTASEQSRALLGVDTDEQAETAFRTMWVEPEVHQISGALLVLHGERDPLITREQQEVFLDLTDDSELRVWDDGEHTIYNRSAERSELVGDWFRARLVGPR